MASLKRVLGFWDCVFINLASIIGAGIFVVIGVASGLAGPAIIISMVVAGIASVFIGLTFAELGQLIPKEGGVFEYGEELLSPFAGFLGGWLWIFAGIVSVSALALALANYILPLIPSLGLPVTFLASIIILIIGLLNFLNVKTSAKLDMIFVVFVVLVLLVFSIFGLIHFNPVNFSNFAPGGAYGVLGGASLVFFDYLGFTKITAMGDEVKNPRRNIPFSIIFSILIVVVLYILTSFAAISLGGSAIYNSSEPLAAAVGGFGTLGVWLISLAAIVAMIQVMFTSIMGSSRVMLAMSGKKFLPKSMAQKSKSGVPIHSIVIISIFSIMLAFTNNLVFVISATSFSYLLFFIISGFAALKLKKSVFPRWVVYGSILVSAALLFFLDFDAWIAGILVVFLAGLYWTLGEPNSVKSSSFKRSDF